MGENFSCLGGSSETTAKNVDVRLYTPKDIEEAEAYQSDKLKLNPQEVLWIQSAVRGFLLRKGLRSPLAEKKEARCWYRIERIYSKTEKPLTEIQNPFITMAETNLEPLAIEKLNDGVQVQLKPALKLGDGSVYEGEWDKDGNKHGKGTLITEDGSKIIGLFRSGILSGVGRLINPSGLVFEGEFKDGKLTGNGKVKGKHGGKFDGSLVDGKLHGFGIEEWPDGMKYEGHYNHGKRHGTGKLTLGDGSSYTGEFFEDKMNGKGNYLWSNGNKYEGNWKDNKMHGTGRFEWKDGRVYEGNFIEDLRSGLGKMKFADGRIYEGEFLDGKQHGKGTLTFMKDGKTVTKKGVWENNSRIAWEDKV